MRVIGETTQRAMVAEDHEVTSATLLTATLIGMGVLLSSLKLRFPRLDTLLEGRPVLL